ncbi:WD repeat-containing protein 55 [Dissostichus eleginoides]|uniref:WD repeat-containing protein 55 n=1 Tax=Dissostichus eleginoides TaxID=100907 RepID=A0AAD9BWT1_DISEL|nr:WD repeat-containing protein 55 [Dissostichus eleginoides]
MAHLLAPSYLIPQLTHTHEEQADIRAVNLFPNRVIGCIGQHVGEPVEEINKSWDSRFLVTEYRKRKKKDGRMKSLTKKAHGENDFFAGLMEETERKEEEEEEEEEEDRDSGSD